MSNKFILHTGGSRVIIALPNDSDTGQFLHCNIMDTRLITIPLTRWTNAISKLGNVNDISQIVYGNYCWLNGILVKNSNDAANDYNDANRRKAKFLSRGYEFVTTFLNMQTLDIASHGYFLTLDDLKLFPRTEDLIPILCDATGLSYEEADNQITIEKNSILNIYKSRKNALWMHCKSLLTVDNDVDYLEWENSVRTISGGMGII